MKFPQFRKYRNEKSFFKVISKEEFEEVKHQPGNQWQLTTFTAAILPDRVFISDMLGNRDDYWETIGEEEYKAMKNRVEEF